MKKKLLSYLILACSICGLTFVGSCKDYEIETLQEEIDNLKVETIDGTIQDQIDAIKQAIGMTGTTAGTPASSSYIEKIYKLLGDTTKLKENSVTKNLDSIYKLLSDAYAQMKLDSAALAKGIDGKVDTAAYQNDLADVYAKIKSDSTDLANKIASIVTCACGWPDNLFITHVNTRLAADSLRLIKDSVRLFKDSVSIAKIEVRLKSDSVRLAQHDNRLKSDSIRLVKDSSAIVIIKDQLKKDSIRLYNDSVELAKIAKRLDRDSIRLNGDSVRLYRDSVAIDSLIKELAKIEAKHADFVGRVELQDSLKNVEKRYKKADSLINESVKALAQSVDSIKDSIRMIWDSITAIRTDLTTLNNKVIKLEQRVDTLENRVDTLELRVDSLMDAEKMRITSLYIQGTENSAFGTFALPFGVRSNVLMAYYGEVKGTVPAGGVNFPTQASSRMWFKENAFTDKDKAMLAASGFNLDADGINLASGEQIFGDSLGNAGKIYFTVNPNEVEIDTTKYAFTLRNSKGDSVKVRLNNIKPSERQLKFGFSTRAGMTSANGFWEADVTIDAADAQSLKPAINKEALVDVAKEMKKTRDLSLTGVTTSVLKSLDNVLDANALNVVWTDSMGKHSVTSGYDLAVATVSPLSYHTLPALMDEFEITKKRLPANPIDELLASIDVPEVKINIDDIKMGSVSFKINPVTYTVNTGLSNIDIDINVYDNNTPPTLLGSGSTSVNMTDTRTKLESTITAVIGEINNSLDGVEDSVKKMVSTIQDDIASQVNTMLDSIQNQLTGQVNKMFNSVKTQIGSNKFVSKVNNLANKLNKVLDNANELLEVALLYDKNDAFHPMSETKSIPSVIEGATSIELCPTSLTADILAPAYKRFVAVTNVIDPSNGKNAQDDGGAYLTALTNANGNSTNMCDVIDADASVTFKPAAGYIYEIAYSAIDYQGYISTRRFYVHVK